MNWKLIFSLSLFGLAMAVATVYWIPSNIEPIFWLGIFLICAYIIARNAPGKYFLHGFLVSLVNSIWITAVHSIFYDTYMANHPEVAEMNANMSVTNPRMVMILAGPIIGAVSGLVQGLLAYLASRLIKKPKEVRM